jgi:predicted TIM-barrel fold metal-dependent hydrolase
MSSGSATLPAAIDVHGHFITPTYERALADAGVSKPDGLPRLPAWSSAAALELMDRIGIAASLLGISSPGIHFGDGAAAARLARALNEEIAALVREQPARFGLLACLPLPEVAAALDELAYAYDELGADGVALLTNVNGTYLGDPSYEPLMAELDRRLAVVVLHPTSPGGFAAVSLGRPSPMLEFPIDTTRTVFELILSGALARYPHIRYIVPHAGGALAVLADRVHHVAHVWHAGEGTVPDVIASLGALHYDLAGPALPRALPALLTLVEPSQLLYGTDFPFAPVATIQRSAAALEQTDALSEPERDAMFRGNALALFPRLASAVTPA